MTDRKGLVPVTQDEVIAGRLCEWSKDGEPPVPLMQEAANLIRHRADALTEALRVVREAREAMKHQPYRNTRTLQCLERLTAFLSQHEGEER